MSVRSLPHFSHKPIGKTTHKKGMSYQNINYIARDEACSKTLSGNMPNDRSGARPFFERAAYKEGVAANARVADTLIIALPVELTREQRWEAIAGYMDKIGHGRIAWLAAFHDQGKDEHNPHAHVIFRDADIETGRKVVGTTTSAKDVKEAQEHGWRVPPRMTTKDLRVAWCEHLNAEMARHGHDVRFDQRTLKEQGIDRDAGIHVGPKANSMAKNSRTFESKDIYALIDTGSRAEHNQRITEENRRREAERRDGQAQLPREPALREGVEKRELRERQAAERKEMYREQSLDRASLREAHDAQKLEHQRWGRALYAEARERAFQELKSQNAERWTEIRKTPDAAKREEAALALKGEQKAAYAKAAETQIAKARPIKNERWENLKIAQEAERKSLQQRHVEEASTLSRQHIAERMALHETWRHQHLDKAAQRTSAKLQAHPGMVPAQQAAASMQARHEQERRPLLASGRVGPATPPLQAAAAYSERARTESQARLSLRYQLEGARSLNQIRAAEPATRRHRPGLMVERRASNRAELQAQRQARQQQADPQSAIRQAVTSGRTLTDGERANASPDVKAGLASQRDRSRREDAFLRFVKQQNSGKGKDRDGGRSGR